MALKRFVTITKNGNNPAYQGARTGVDRLSAKLGVRVEHMTPVVPDSIAEQIEFLEQVLRDPPHALLISPAHVTDLDDALEGVRDAGIPVVMFVGQTARRDLALSFVGSDDRGMTSAVGSAVGSAIGGQGRAFIIDGNPLGILYQPRAAGFREGLGQYPGVTLVASRDGDFLREPAYAAMLALLEEHDAPDAVLVANDFSALGVIDALRERGVRACVGAVNATPDGIEAIRRGEMLATAAFNAMAMGCIALEAAIRIDSGQNVPRHIVLPAELVTGSNLERWDAPYAQRPLPDWNDTVAAFAA